MRPFADRTPTARGETPSAAPLLLAVTLTLAGAVGLAGCATGTGEPVPARRLQPAPSATASGGVAPTASASPTARPATSANPGLLTLDAGAWEDASAAGSLAALAATGGARADERTSMVADQLARRGIEDPRVLAAMARVPRHRFIPLGRRGGAYADGAQPIGYGQTISQPYVVALMSDLLQLQPGDRVLEIGTGSGYHAAVLADLAEEVYSIEILKPLADRARRTLAELGFDNVRVRMGDGYRGWPAAAPFDAVLLTAAPPKIPQPLLDQLAVGGRLVAPVGEGVQELIRITRNEDGFEEERIATVYFVPMTGEAENGGGPS